MVRAECRLPPHAFQQSNARPRLRLNPAKLAEAGVAQSFEHHIHTASQQPHANHLDSWAQFMTAVQQASAQLLLEHSRPQKDWLTEPTKALLANKQSAWLLLVQMRMNEKKGPPVSVTGKRNPGQVPSGPQMGMKRKDAPSVFSEKSHGASSSFGGLQCGSSPNCGVASPIEVKSYGHAVEEARQSYRAAKNAARKAVA